MKSELVLIKYFLEILYRKQTKYKVSGLRIILHKFIGMLYTFKDKYSMTIKTIYTENTYLEMVIEFDKRVFRKKDFVSSPFVGFEQPIDDSRKEGLISRMGGNL